MEKTRDFDLLGKVRDKGTAIFKTLEGVELSLSKQLGLSSCPLIMSDNVFAELRKDPETERFPYGYFKITSFSIVRDQQAVKTLGRTSTGMSFDEFTNSTIAKDFTFPLHMQIEFNISTNDFGDALWLLQKVAIIDALDKFTFKMSLPPFQDWMVSLNLNSPENAVPESVLEDPTAPGTYKLNFNMLIKTHCGVSKQVAKINNSGKVTTNVNVAGDKP